MDCAERLFSSNVIRRCTGGLAICFAFCVRASAGETNGGVDTTFARGSFASTWLARDLNCDGVVTDVDAAMGVYEAIKPLIGTDANGDGLVASGDLALLVTRVMSVAAGDINGDGATTDDDFYDAIERLGRSSTFDLQIDIDGDRKSDFEDVFGVLGKINQSQWVGANGKAFARVTMLIEDAIVDGEQIFWVDYSETDKHNVDVSSGWQKQHHAKGVSASWMPNHLWGISVRWPSLSDRGDEKWPANHPMVVSGGWVPSADHAEATSAKELYHDSEWSFRWRNVPGHARESSVTWDPDGSGPQTHDASLSRGMPPNHTLAQSIESPRQPGAHHQVLTCQWLQWPDDCDPLQYVASKDPGHPRLWRRWPPSHFVGVSEGWAEHMAELSLSWPPNHSQSVSKTWPKRVVGVGRFPPNHVHSQSKLDYGHVPNSRGVDDWPTWPANHIWLTTIRDGLQFDVKPIPLIPCGVEVGESEK